MSVQPIPAGYSRITPYLVVDGAAEAIEFYKQAFGATERMRMPMPNGKVGHAEITFGDATVMLADENSEMGFNAPGTVGGTPVSILLYTEDVDAVFTAAVEAGATPVREVTTQFYGDRSGMLTDPFGHVWTIATHVEDVPPEEMDARMAEAMKDGGCGSAEG